MAPPHRTLRLRRLDARPLALLAALQLLLGCSQQAEPPDSAILITLDTTRYDALGFNGAPSSVTPHLDALAAEGVRYTWARTVAPLTVPAHASMMTGLYPLRHGVRNNGPLPLPQAATTLAERARAAGLETAAFVAAAVLDRRIGLAQGFDHYDEPSRSGQRKKSTFKERPAAEVVEALEGWIEERDRDRPFFLWIHFFDPHAPYEPEEPFRSAIRNPYLAEVAAMDAAIGRLLESLEEGGLLERSTLLVCADHGESLGQHGEPTHGTQVYDATLRVPFLLRYSDRFRAGETAEELVSVVDVYPTLCEALGISPGAGLDGASLFRRTAPARGVYFETYAPYLDYGWSPLCGWADATGKFIHGARPQMFDPRRDPAEAQDHVASPAYPSAPYEEALRELLRAPRLARSETPLGAEVMEKIRSLGYTAAAAPDVEVPEPLDPTELPAPRDRLEELLDGVRAAELGDAGRYEQAVPILERITLANPRNLFALDTLGFHYGRLRRYEDQVRTLRTSIARGSERSQNHLNLGIALRNLGRMDEARASLRRALELDPTWDRARNLLQRILEELGED